MHHLIKQFLDHILCEKRFSYNTYLSYKFDLSHYQDYLSNNSIIFEQATTKDIKNFMKYLCDKNISARSRSRKTFTLKRFYLYLEDRHGLKDISKDIEAPPFSRGLPIYMSENELAQLFEISQLLPIRDRFLILLTYYTAARVSEITNLKKEDISIAKDNRFIKLKGKGSKERLVPFHKSLIPIYKKYLVEKKYESPYLFPQLYGGRIRPICRQTFNNILKNAWQKTKIKKKISPHKLRHSMATHLLQKGANIRQIQVILGHEKIDSTMIYTHLNIDHLKTIYNIRHPRAR